MRVSPAGFQPSRKSLGRSKLSPTKDCSFERSWLVPSVATMTYLYCGIAGLRKGAKGRPLRPVRGSVYPMRRMKEGSARSARQTAAVREPGRGEVLPGHAAVLVVQTTVDEEDAFGARIDAANDRPMVAAGVFGPDGD